MWVAGKARRRDGVEIMERFVFLPRAKARAKARAKVQSPSPESTARADSAARPKETQRAGQRGLRERSFQIPHFLRHASRAAQKSELRQYGAIFLLRPDDPKSTESKNARPLARRSSLGKKKDEFKLPCASFSYICRGRIGPKPLPPTALLISILCS